MIFFGTGGGLAGTAPLPHVSCVNCGQPNTLDALFYSRYFHLYWIPTFPVGMKGMTACEFCKQALEEKDLPGAYQPAYQQAKSQVKTPVRHFAGLIIVGLLLVAIMVLGG